MKKHETVIVIYAEGRRQNAMGEELTVTNIIVTAITSDKRVRQAVLTPKQNKQVLGFIRYIQGGTLQLTRESTPLKET